MKHRDTHPFFVDGCFGCKAMGVSFGAVPGGARNQASIAVDRREAQWDRDGDAYKRLRADGFQPPRIDGCHALERDASRPEHVEIGRADIKPDAFKVFEDSFGHRATEAA